MKEKKIALSVDQMKHLDKLGLDTSGASMMYVKDWTGGYALYFMSDKFDRQDGDILTYTFQDILENHLFNLKWDKPENLIQFGMDDMSMWIEDINSNILCEVEFKNKSILDCAYEILCWCIKKNYT